MRRELCLKFYLRHVSGPLEIGVQGVQKKRTTHNLQKASDCCSSFPLCFEMGYYLDQGGEYQKRFRQSVSTWVVMFGSYDSD